MSHTASSFHDVADVSIGAPVTTPDYRWQIVTIHMSDGSNHVITAFLAPGAAEFPQRAAPLPPPGTLVDLRFAAQMDD